MQNLSSCNSEPFKLLSIIQVYLRTACAVLGTYSSLNLNYKSVSLPDRPRILARTRGRNPQAARTSAGKFGCGNLFQLRVCQHITQCIRKRQIKYKKCCSCNILALLWQIMGYHKSGCLVSSEEYREDEQFEDRDSVHKNVGRLDSS